MGNKIKERAERNGKIRRTVSKIEQTVDKLERLKDEYLEKAVAAKARGDKASYGLCKSALNTTLTQIKRAKEMLLNIEITAELQKMGETNADFLTGMSTVAKRISKINKQSDFVKLQKEIQKALTGMEEAQAGLDVFLSSADAHFAAISETRGSLSDRQIEELVSGNVTEKELLVDARLDAIMEDVETAPEPSTNTEKAAELDGAQIGDNKTARTVAKPFPSPRGVFDFAPRKSKPVSADVFGEDGELPLKLVIEFGDKPNIILGQARDGVKRVGFSSAPVTLVGGMIGSGKSAFLHSLICSLAVAHTAEEVRFLLFDFHGEELCAYNGITHMAADTITSVQEAAPTLKALSAEIERRYESMRALGAEDIDGYNEKAEQKLPYIIAAIDEYSDAMAVSDFERSLLAIMQSAAKTGVYFVLATRNTDAKTLTSGILSAAKCRIVFKTATAEAGGALGAAEAASLDCAGELVYVEADGSTTVCRAPYISSSGVARAVSALWENVL